MGTDTPPPFDPPAGDGVRLDGWKEIAAYFNRHVATVRRWEKTEALPVHRHLHDKLGSVYAFRGELDVWWRNRRVRLEAEGTAEVRPPDEAAGETADRLEPEERWVATRSGLRRGPLQRRMVGAVLALALVTVAYAVSRAGPGRRTEIRSLAVMPLRGPVGRSGSGVLRRRHDRRGDHEPRANSRPARHLPHLGDAIQRDPPAAA